MEHLKYFVIILLFPFCAASQIQYPASPIKSITDIYHGTKIIDDYRWLEDQNNDSVVDWVKEQNEVSIKYLNKLTRPEETNASINKYMYSDYGNYDGQIKRTDMDDKIFFRYFVTSTNSARSLYYKRGIEGNWKPLVSSTELSTRKDRINISFFKPSKNNNLIAYQYNRNGSDWKEIRIVKIHKRMHYQEVLKNTITHDIVWLRNGFFYKKYAFDSINAKRGKPDIMFHNVGTKQEDDKLMFKSYSEFEEIDIYGEKSEKLFIVKKRNLKNNTFYYYTLDPSRPEFTFKPFLLRTAFDLDFIAYKGNQVYVLTTVNNKIKLVAIDINDPTKFKVLSPDFEESELDEIEMMDDKIVLSYYSPLGSSALVMIDYNGNVINHVELPKGLSISSLVYSNAYAEFFFFLESYTIPEVLYKLDLKTFEYEMVEETKVNFDFKGYKFIQQTFQSSDDTEVPIFIVFKDSLKQDGKTPFLLKTYGGYGSTNKPSYDSGIVYFIENGGAFAYVDIRGSGGLGNEWWYNGRGLNKKNGINDFISAAEYLIERKYTSPKKIGIIGASHGGLITAAALTQRPDLFGSAVIDVGVLDMLRAENFTAGAHRVNIKEFGTVNDSTQFKNLLSYSPYHNIKKEVDYPSTLVITGDYDNRVPPLHSYKFAAKLQNNPSQKNPIILWTQEKTGHYGADNMYDFLKEKSFIYGFLFHELANDD